jgi:hypothetical protein
VKSFPVHWVESLYHCPGHQLNNLLVKQTALVSRMLSVHAQEALKRPVLAQMLEQNKEFVKMQ